MFFLLPAMIASVFFPIIAGASDPLKYIDQIKQSSKAAFLISAFGCLILAASGYWLFPYVFGSDFNNMYQPFLLMIPGIIAYCSLFQMTAYFAGRNMVIKNIIGTILSLLFLVTLDPIVIPLAGTNGAAIVLSLSYLIFSIYMIYEFKKEVERLKLEQI
jgi:O-antigen/teichoic acid export membrane protein